MDSTKTLLVVSAAVFALIGAGVANAAIVDFNVSLAGGFQQVGYGGTTITGAGSGVLDDSTGVFTMNLTETIVVAISPASALSYYNGTYDTTFTDVFSGTVAGGVFTPTSSTSGMTGCGPSGIFCGDFLPLGPKPQTAVNGSFGSLTEAAGGTLQGQLLPAYGGSTSTYTVTPVPLPGAGLLLGSGLLGLAGSGRRRRADQRTI